MNASCRYQPVILIGAARSGTKILRDTLAQHPQFDRVPYDVNYIWRMGNEQGKDDALEPGSASPRVKQRIIRHIDRYSTGKPYLIEKTVGNCLRIPFVLDVYPNAKVVHLIRDGRDVVESAFRQWTASPDWRYIFRKAQAFPLAAAPRYAALYAMRTIRRAVGTRAKRVPTWGPLYAGIHEDLDSKSVLEVCAEQWRHSVESALQGLDAVPKDNCLQVRYEDFVSSPSSVLGTILAFVGVSDADAQGIDCTTISDANRGKGFRNLSQEEQQQVLAIIAPLLMRLKYI